MGPTSRLCLVDCQNHRVRNRQGMRNGMTPNKNHPTGGVRCSGVPFRFINDPCKPSNWRFPLRFTPVLTAYRFRSGERKARSPDLPRLLPRSGAGGPRRWRSSELRLTRLAAREVDEPYGEFGGPLQANMKLSICLRVLTLGFLFKGNQQERAPSEGDSRTRQAHIIDKPTVTLVFSWVPFLRLVQRKTKRQHHSVGSPLC